MTSEFEKMFMEIHGHMDPISWGRLVAEVARNPAVARSLVRFLRFEEELSFQLAYDRSHFLNRVRSATTERVPSEHFVVGVTRRIHHVPVRRILSRPRGSRILSAVIVAAMVAIAVLLIGFGVRAGNRDLPVVMETTGGLTTGTGTNLHIGDRLSVGMTICSGLAGSARIRYHDGSTIQLDPGTRLMVRSSAAGKALELLKGQLTATIAHQPVMQLVILSSDALITVVGTRFSLRDSELGCALKVVQGAVKISARSGDSALAF